MLEGLEDRLVPSTASLSLQAVTDNFGQSTAFYLGEWYPNATHSYPVLYQRDNQGVHILVYGSPQTYSAGVDATGHAHIFAKYADGSMWDIKSAVNWTEILGPGANIGSFAAVQGGRCYFQNLDNSLWVYNPASAAFGSAFQQIDGPGAVQSIDAVTDSYGRDAVFAIRGDGSFGEYYNGGYTQLLGVNAIGPGFSAGLDINGRPDVYCNIGWWFLEHNSYSGWRLLDTNGSTRAISATNNETVDVIAGDGTLKQYDQYGNKFNLSSGATFTEISAANSTNLYMVQSDGSGWEYINAPLGNGWYLSYWQQFASPYSVL
jgi:hypothetical protein